MYFTRMHYKSRDMLHKHHTHAKGCLQTQQKLDHLLTIPHHQSSHMGTYNHVVNMPPTTNGLNFEARQFNAGKESQEGRSWIHSKK